MKFNTAYAFLKARMFQTTGPNLQDPNAVVDYVSMATKPQNEGIRGEIQKWLDSLGVGDMNVFRHVERLVMLFVSVSQTTSVAGFVAAFGLYAGDFYSGSIVEMVESYCFEMFAGPQGPGGDDENKGKSWSEFFRNLRNNWESVKLSPLFENFSRLLGLAVAMEFCRIEDVTLNVKQVKMWGPDLKLLHADAFSLIDAAFQTVSFFAEKFTESWEKGSISHFFYPEDKAIKLDQILAQLRAEQDYLLAGSIEKLDGRTDTAYQKDLDYCISEITEMLRQEKNDMRKRVLSDKLMWCTAMEKKIVAAKVGTKSRRAPFGYGVRGVPEVGKSEFVKQLNKILLQSAGLDTSEELNYTKNLSAQYWDGFKSKMTTILFDDCGSGNPQLEKTNYAEEWIKVMNRVAFSPNMAALPDKDTRFAEPEIGCCTSNDDHFGFRSRLSSPDAGMRRFDLLFTQRVKPEFRKDIGNIYGIDKQKVRKWKDENPGQPIDDVWEFDVAMWECSGRNGTLGKEVWLKKNATALEAAKISVRMFHEHRNHEIKCMAEKTDADNVPLCGVDGCTAFANCCYKHSFLPAATKSETTIPAPAPSPFEGVSPAEMEIELSKRATVLADMEQFGKQFGKAEPNFDTVGDFTVAAFTKVQTSIWSTIKREVFGICDNLDRMGSIGLLTAGAYFYRHFDWLKFVPTPWINNPTFRRLAMSMDYKRLRNRYVTYTCGLWSLVGCGTFSLFTNERVAERWPSRIRRGAAILPLCTIGGLMMQRTVASIIDEGYRRELAERNTIADMYRGLRDHYMPKVYIGSAIIAAVLLLGKVYSATRGMESQGSLTPETPEDVAARDASPNPWYTGFFGFSRASISEKARTTTPSDVSRKVFRNTVYLKTTHSNEFGNALFIRSCLLLVPNHYFDDRDELQIEVTTNNPLTRGKKSLKASISKRFSWRPQGQADIRFCYLPIGGDFADISDFFPESPMPGDGVLMRWRDSEAEECPIYGKTTPSMTGYGGLKFQGGVTRNMTENTFRGLCGVPLVGQGRDSAIHGIHVAGKTGENRGCYCYVSRDHVDEAVVRLSEMAGVVLPASQGVFEKQIHGRQVIIDENLHPKSVANLLPEDSHIAFMGHTGGRVTSRSDVRVTLISEHVADVLDAPNIYCGPKMKPERYAWETNLRKMMEPAKMFPGELLHHSVQDYMSPIRELFHRKMWNDIGPLTEQQNLCGIPGKKFIDAMNMNTAAGFAFTGKKRDWVEEEVDPETNLLTRKLNCEMRTEVVRQINCWREGKRSYPIINGCKKDEVLSKVKCRIFFGSTMALVYNVRKYFLPIVRVFQMNPLTTECAVGINAHGPEWEELREFIHAKENLFGGDYGSYDTKLSSQLLMAAFSCLIECASMCNYSADDIAIMRAMVSDIVFAVINFDGNVLQMMLGVHISGNPLTVILNGICGSLNLRAYFFHANPTFVKDAVDFRSCVNLITYGDDNIGTVNGKNCNFTIKGASEFLAQYGQIYTMPDKESELADYLDRSQDEFLKRNSVYIPELKRHLGALSTGSMHKMLHCYLRNRKSPLTEEQACAQNIDTVLLEAFNHGREFYEDYRAKMKIVAERSGLAHMCDRLEETFDDRVDRWRETYEPSDGTSGEA